MFGMKRSRGAAMLLASGVQHSPIDESSVKKQRTSSDATDDGSAQAIKQAALPRQPQLDKPPSSSIDKAEITNEEGRSLLRIWEVMLNALPMLNKRKEKVTVSTLAPIVEAHTGKRFKSEHAQKIKHLYPEAFTWQHIVAPNRIDKQPEHQLLLQFDRPGRKRLSESEERRELKERIFAFQSSPDPHHEFPLAPLPPKDASSSMVDGVVKPLKPHPSSSPSFATAVATPSSSRTALYPPPPSATPLSPTDSISCRPPMHKPTLQAHPPNQEQARPRARNPLLQRFMSAEALDILDEAEAKQSSLPEIMERRAMLNALAKLPTAFDMVRYIFGLGARSPSLMEREEVVEKIKAKSTERSGISLQDARLQVNLLLQHAPEFIRAEGPSRILDRGVDIREGGREKGSMLRIDRSWDELDKLRPRLVKLSVEAQAELKSSYSTQ